MTTGQLPSVPPLDLTEVYQPRKRWGPAAVWRMMPSPDVREPPRTAHDSHVFVDLKLEDTPTSPVLEKAANRTNTQRRAKYLAAAAVALGVAALILVLVFFILRTTNK